MVAFILKYRRFSCQTCQNCIKKVETLEFEDLGMEAIRKIEVENFLLYHYRQQGNDFFMGENVV